MAKTKPNPHTGQTAATNLLEGDVEVHADEDALVGEGQSVQAQLRQGTALALGGTGGKGGHGSF